MWSKSDFTMFEVYCKFLNAACTKITELQSISLIDTTLNPMILCSIQVNHCFS